MDSTQEFCRIVRQRSIENKRGIDIVLNAGLKGQAISILRQELDSMVRVIYLLSLSLDERSQLINLTLTGKKWKLGKTVITDRLMVELADTLHGWTKSVYEFGCSFIHLSTFHDYVLNDPFQSLNSDEIDSIKTHLHNYHGYQTDTTLTVQSIGPFLPMVFDKISSNLECYVQSLEKHETELI